MLSFCRHHVPRSFLYLESKISLQQHLRKPLVQFAEHLIQTGIPHGAERRHPLRLLHRHRLQGRPAALVLIAVSVGLHIKGWNSIPALVLFLGYVYDKDGIDLIWRYTM